MRVPELCRRSDWGLSHEQLRLLSAFHFEGPVTAGRQPPGQLHRSEYKEMRVFARRLRPAAMRKEGGAAPGISRFFPTLCAWLLLPRVVVSLFKLGARRPEFFLALPQTGHVLGAGSPPVFCSSCPSDRWEWSLLPHLSDGVLGPWSHLPCQGQGRSLASCNAACAVPGTPGSLLQGLGLCRRGQVCGASCRPPGLCASAGSFQRDSARPSLCPSARGTCPSSPPRVLGDRSICVDDQW